LHEVQFAYDAEKVNYLSNLRVTPGKIAIHPDHVLIVNEAFAATDDDVAYAKPVIEAFAPGADTVVLDGKMIICSNLSRGPCSRCPIGALTTCVAPRWSCTIRLGGSINLAVMMTFRL